MLSDIRGGQGKNFASFLKLAFDTRKNGPYKPASGTRCGFGEAARSAGRTSPRAGCYLTGVNGKGCVGGGWLSMLAFGTEAARAGLVVGVGVGGFRRSSRAQRQVRRRLPFGAGVLTMKLVFENVTGSDDGRTFYRSVRL